MRRIDTPDELFAPGNPATSTKGSTVRNWWLNAIQEELAGVVEGLGGTLDPADNGQLFDWLIASLAMKVGDATQIFRAASAVGNNDVLTLGQAAGLGLRAATDAAVGVVELATDAEVQAGTDTARAVTPAGLLAGILGASGVLSNGYAVFPVRDATTGVRKNIVIQWATGSAVVGADALQQIVTLPIAFPTSNLFSIVTTALTSGLSGGVSLWNYFDKNATSVTAMVSNYGFEETIAPRVIAIGY